MITTVMEYTQNNISNDIKDILDIYGTYWVDMFYNSLYKVAKDRKNSSTCLADSYRSAVSTYVSNLSTNNELYMESIVGLHIHFCVYQPNIRSTSAVRDLILK